ncbi:MAG: AbrB/MazE/SpoVT family DNA-binding domain-containing protein [Pseudonocardia sp.]|nr:AbrB/MazE/SpoVT family DNA-binding domain-containing protein [Pseudonocardia sp.]
MTGYGMSAMDGRGRISDRVLTAVLAWTPGTALTATTTPDGVITLAPEPDGRVHLPHENTLRLPADIRHRCRLHAGDRLLLLADPEHNQLRLYPPTVLDELLNRHLAGPRR